VRLANAKPADVDELAVKQRIVGLERLMRAAGLVPEAFTRVADDEREGRDS